ncbi:hypothetical protein GCM10011610_53760 [Nocardia rhizosphaerihabitans]|uniref:Uncharacterized protein n=1 Tax=Nocardia rhizosphaerihabitans TaxID=1691570 RepID=A0ABQ2KV45_9NOCA|nr:hypothetical protein GCM10011610_53760 [Nocardia rhizosphaerihabitans]
MPAFPESTCAVGAADEEEPAVEEESSLQPARSRAKTVALAAMAAVVLLTQRDASAPENTSPPVWLTGGNAVTAKMRGNSPGT